MALITDADEAKRLAERFVADVALYNRERIRRALKHDRLFEDLAQEIQEAREMYLARVDPELERAHNLFNRAIVDIIVKPYEHEETTIW